MFIVHLSDSHITDCDKKAYGLVPTAENLAQCVAHINRLIPKPDIVLITGDITQNGRVEEAERAAAILDQLHLPYCIVPGNHDNPSILRTVFCRAACPGKEDGILNYVLDGYEIRLIGMDSTAAIGPGGELHERQINWLQQQLSMENEKPTILFMHHPPAKFGVPETDEDGFVGADKFEQLIARHGNVKAILCGHIHLVAHQFFAGTVISTAPSMGLQLALDLTMSRPSEFIREPPGYLFHYFTAEKKLISHSVIVKDLDGPYPFQPFSHSKSSIQGTHEDNSVQ